MSKKNYRLLIILVFTFYFCHVAYSQNNKQQTNFTIKWIKQFSGEKDFGTHEGIRNKIFNFVLGTKKQQLFRPFGILVTEKNRWLILDQGKQTLMIADWANKKMVSVEAPKLPDFFSLVAICQGIDQTIYFTDSRSNHIYFIDSEQNKIQILNDSLKLKQPTGITFLRTKKEIWVVETKAHQIQVLDTGGNKKRKIGTRGTGNGEFNFPSFIWSDEPGQIYVIDSMNFRVQIFNDRGEIISVFGEPGDASGYFSRPKGIATDSFGNIYVVDGIFNSVQIFNQEGKFLLNFGEQGNKPGQFWMPAGIFIDENNFIYVADTYNARIQVFQLLNGDNNEN